MTKGKLASKVKLGNKFSNKKNKVSGTNKSLQKYQFKKKKTAKGSASKHQPKRREEAQRIDYTRRHSDDNDEMDIDEAEFSDDDMKIYLENQSKNLSFLSKCLNDGKVSTGKDSDISLFEVIPRKSSNLYTEEEKDGKSIDLLPIKGEKGLIQRKGQRQIIGKEKDTEEQLEKEDNKVEVVEKQPMSVIEILAAHKEEINKKKLKIARLSMDVVENPYENIVMLKHILNFSENEEPLTIRKLALLSLLEVFKDIIPSYRIRELTEQEKSVKVSKDVRKIRDFEDNLLRTYQKYLQNLEENAKDGVKSIKKRKGQSMRHLKTAITMTNTSIKCLAELLQHVPHFNFRKNIINVLVSYVELKDDLIEAGDSCFHALKSALCADYSGNVALDIVSMIQTLAKTKPNLNPRVLEALLYLRVDADLIHATERKGNKIERLKAKQEAIKKLSRKEKKRKKVEDKLNKELQEAEAVENRDKIGKTHTEVLKRLFVIYFRVLKLGKKSALLTIVLKGLARFAHLINIDFFGDLMSCLESILRLEELSTQDKLHCILTALKILSGQGDVLTIDPRQFYAELYNVILNFMTEMDATCFGSMKECLDIMLIKRRKQVSHPQILGYLKRLGTILLQMPPERISDMFLLMRSIFQLYEKCDYLLDNESFGCGVFQPDIINPEHSNADSTALWELSLLTRCYTSDAQLYCNHILNGAPSHGPGSLPQRLLNRSGTRQEQDVDQISHYIDNLPEKPIGKRRNKNKPNIDWPGNEYTEVIDDIVNKKTTQYIDEYLSTI